MKEKIRFFIKMKKVLWILGLLAFLLILIYFITFNSPPIGELSIEMANSIWNIVINLSCGYLISLMFYIMLVFNSDYNEYLKKKGISKKVSDYYYRLETAIREMFDILVLSARCIDIQEFINEGINYCEIKNEIITYDENGMSAEVKCKDVFEKAVRSVNENLNKIEPYLIFLNKKAIYIFIGLQKTYIFENIDNDKKLGEKVIFDIAVTNFLDRLVEVYQELRDLNKGGFKSIIED